jgi:hypothetical protein
MSRLTHHVGTILGIDIFLRRWYAEPSQPYHWANFSEAQDRVVERQKDGTGSVILPLGEVRAEVSEAIIGHGDISAPVRACPTCTVATSIALA